MDNYLMLGQLAGLVDILNSVTEDWCCTGVSEDELDSLTALRDQAVVRFVNSVDDILNPEPECEDCGGPCEY